MAWYSALRSFRRHWIDGTSGDTTGHLSRNGTVEQNHWIIKAIAKRGAMLWYNMSPRSRQLEKTILQRAISNYQWRHLRIKPVTKQADLPESMQVGVEVWFKPPGTQCSTKWGRGIITGVQSHNNVEVDGEPRHVLDLRLIQDSSENDGDTEWQLV